MINLVIGICYVVLGCAIVLLCKPLMAGKIGPNRWYGFRLKESYISDEHWYRINEYGARRMIPWGLFLAIVGLVPLAFALEAPRAELLCGCLTWAPLVLLLPVVQTWLFARGLSMNDTAR